MWSDETSVTAYPTGRKIIIKVHSSTKETDLPFIPKVQKGGFSVMFWDCFTRYAKGPLTVPTSQRLFAIIMMKRTL